MNRTSYLNTWKCARAGLKTHWMINAGTVLALVSILSVLYAKALTLLPLLIILSYIHGLLVSHFVQSHFFEKRLPMLPQRKPRGVVFMLIEWVYNLSTVCCIIGTLKHLDASLVSFSLSETASVLVAWWIGWIGYQLLSRLGVFAIFVFVGFNYLPIPSDWLIWKMLISLTALLVFGVNLGKQFEKSTESPSETKFSRKRIKKTSVSYVNPYRIRSEFIQNPNLMNGLRIGLIELIYCVLIFSIGVSVHSLMDYFPTRQFAIDHSKLMGMFFTLAFVRLSLKITFSYILENGLIYLPAISRETLRKRTQRYSIIDRTCTLLALIFVPLSIDLLLNLVTHRDHLFSPNFRYFVLAILLFVPVISIILATLASDRNRTIFSGKFSMSLFEYKQSGKQSKFFTLIWISVAVIAVVFAGIILIARNQTFITDLSEGQYLVIWLPIYLAIIGIAYWLEHTWNKRAYQTGDLV